MDIQYSYKMYPIKSNKHQKKVSQYMPVASDNVLSQVDVQMPVRRSVLNLMSNPLLKTSLAMSCLGPEISY